MSYHDEAQFQRINQARNKHVAELRGALNAAGLREKGGVSNLQIGNPQTQALNNWQQSSSEGYDIEQLIRAAAALRAALAPFDTSITQAVGEAA